MTIYPKNEKQKSLLKSLFEEMKVRFEVEKEDEQVQYSEKEFIAKVDKSLKQAKAGKTTKLGKDQQKELLSFHRVDYLFPNANFLKIHQGKSNKK